MTRNVIYEVGDVRVWRGDLYTMYLEVIDGHRRLSTWLDAIKDVPDLLSVLIEHLIPELDRYLKALTSRCEKLKERMKVVEEGIEEYRKKYGEEFYRVEELAKEREEIVKRLEIMEQAVSFGMALKDRLTTILNDLNKFSEIVEKVREQGG